TGVRSCITTFSPLLEMRCARKCRNARPDPTLAGEEGDAEDDEEHAGDDAPAEAGAIARDEVGEPEHEQRCGAGEGNDHADVAEAQGQQQEEDPAVLRDPTPDEVEE